VVGERREEEETEERERAKSTHQILRSRHIRREPLLIKLIRMRQISNPSIKVVNVRPRISKEVDPRTVKNATRKKLSNKVSSRLFPFPLTHPPPGLQYQLGCDSLEQNPIQRMSKLSYRRSIHCWFQSCSFQRNADENEKVNKKRRVSFFSSLPTYLPARLGATLASRFSSGETHI